MKISFYKLRIRHTLQFKWWNPWNYFVHHSYLPCRNITSHYLIFIISGFPMRNIQFFIDIPIIYLLSVVCRRSSCFGLDTVLLHSYQYMQYFWLFPHFSDIFTSFSKMFLYKVSSIYLCRYKNNRITFLCNYNNTFVRIMLPLLFIPYNVPSYYTA